MQKLFEMETIEQRIEILEAALANALNCNRQWLSVDEAANYLRVKPSTIHMKTHRGEIPHYKIGGKLLFDKQELNNIVEKKH